MEDCPQYLILTDFICIEKMREEILAIEDCLEFAIRNLEVYVHGYEERLIRAAKLGLASELRFED